MKISQSGYSLIEVMISLLLMGLTIYLFDAIQIAALRINQRAYYLTQAAQQIISMQEKLFALSDHDGLPQQIEQWNEQNRELLPDVKSTVLGRFPFYQIKLCWQQGGRGACLSTPVEIIQG